MNYPQDALFAAPETQADEDEHAPARTELQDAAEQTITALTLAGGLDESHALKLALIRNCARVLDREMAGPKITVAATSLISTMIDTVNGLPTVTATLADQFDRLSHDLGYSADA